MESIPKKRLLMSFGETLSRIRKEKDISYRELAQLCDVDHSQISKIEKGKISLQVVTLFELAKGLNIEPSELLNFEFEYE
ncbi:helix-turn-helix domain-containing protein [Flavivirga eckloniae]|uniref:XRE family transcriptional regulator n=1 Tax=Flavivirga eckloniae TaxID=1803846 RepID=A0A2K9PMF4_9FLAO|nr:helix-turn-helix transcriptional regulator [Flavivirga eckloniae]AUP78230.1 XRE family transcriptional regulator [Flavivirga eckloniae]